MITHNQKGLPVSWEALGKTYEWEPFGSCDVPEQLFEHIKLEGLPIDLSPVPPKAKADAALEEEQSAARADALRRLQKELDSAKAELAESKKATEAAEQRAAEAVESAQASDEKLKLLTDQLRQAKSDAEEFEKMATEAQAEAAELKAKAQAQSAEKSQKQGRQSRK